MVVEGGTWHDNSIRLMLPLTIIIILNYMYVCMSRGNKKGII